MGMTMPLDRDALVYPMPGSLIGELHEAADTANAGRPDRPEMRLHRIDSRDDTLSVLLELQRCGGKMVQHCAFVSLPDGSSAYIEERIAEKAVTLAGATSGNVVINDDTRWVYQSKPRRFFGQMGELTPTDSTLYKTCWLNIDDRQGYITLGGTSLRLTKVAGQPGIWRRTGTMYDTCRLEYVQLPRDLKPNSDPVRFDAGQRIGVYALVALPNAKADETKSLADEINKTGWIIDSAGCLALKIRTYLVYANFSSSSQRIAAAGAKDLPAKTCGWMTVGVSGYPRQ